MRLNGFFFMGSQTRIGYIKEFYDLFVKIWNKFCNFTDNIKG